MNDDRPKPTTYVEHIRLLCCEFEIQTNSQEVIAQLSSLTQRAEQDMPVTHRSTVTITWTGDEFRISGGGIDDDFELSAVSALETLYQHMHRRTLAALPDHIRLRAASGVHAGRSFLIAGPQRAGKTTLALRLMLGGLDITGDELVLLRDGKAVAFPRKFQVREDSLALMPRLEVLKKRFAPIIENPQQGRIVGIDPLAFGRPWHIVPTAVSTIFCIEPNHGARTTLVRCGKVEMTRRVLALCAPPLSGRRDWLADLCGTVDRADTFVVALGDLDTALTAIAEALG